MNITWSFTKNLFRKLLNKFGVAIVRRDKMSLQTANTQTPARRYPADFDAVKVKICEEVSPYTMTSVERVGALIDAVNYVAKANIEGALVECGVWRGGSAMAMMMTIIKYTHKVRDVYLYDTYSGMNQPSEEDVTYKEGAAIVKFRETEIAEGVSSWCLSTLDEVQKNMLITGYPQNKIHFIEGAVEKTIPNEIPDKIAILRLDTDWYGSTKHELEYLFPLLQPNGVLILDDYGHWQGARKAVDEYFLKNNVSILLNRIDYTGRIAIKTV